MKVVVTGGAGFIGSHVVERLLREEYEVSVVDNLSSGSLENLKNVRGASRFSFFKGDLRNIGDVKEAFKNTTTVFHLAANPEVRLGDPLVHYENNIQATFNVLELMRKLDIKEIVFASSSTVYGEAKRLPTPENYGPLKPISVYGASKLACEALISSYTHTYGFKGIILRYANVVGPRHGRGVVHDFVIKLLKNPRKLEILGDGTQRKSYIWIEDAVNASLLAWKRCNEELCVFNIGSEDSITVKEIADIVVEEMGLKSVEYAFTGGVKGGRGWIGDVKVMHLDISKLISLGFKPRYRSSEAVRLAARYHIQIFKH